MNKILLGIILFSTTITLTSCNPDVVYDQSKKVDPKGWNMNKKVEFDVKIEDTLRFYDFALNIRNTTDYPNCNVFFFIKTIYPDGSITKSDTVECYLSYMDGSWTGKGSGKIKDNRFWFTQKVVFPQKGVYRFEIQQATRDTNLVGISDIGLHIEYHKDRK
ncbi:MAG: gliding motility lipoprotein GldH [Bacteroidales bacterium]|nr:gliding motility lipoprotein GldH [Bacteroidales bacterium]